MAFYAKVSALHACLFTHIFSFTLTFLHTKDFCTKEDKTRALTIVIDVNNVISLNWGNLTLRLFSEIILAEIDNIVEWINLSSGLRNYFVKSQVVVKQF